MNKDDLIELGFCRKPHGVKGAFAFSLHNPKESILKKGHKIWVTPLSKESSIASQGQFATIKSISFGNKVICFLEEVADRNTVESWIPFSISLERTAFPEAEEGELYLNDLMNCDVFNQDGVLLGKVSAIGSNGVQDIIQVKGAKESFDVLLIDSFIVEIDIENKKVVINEPEYL
jgi:16S rRNA processing protein RimM